MNETRNLEMQLRSWLPRRPSEKVKQRIFGNGDAVEQTTTAGVNEMPRFRLGWLVPAAAALVLTCLLFNQRNGPLNYGSTGSQPIVATIMSNQSAPAYFPGTFQREQSQRNHLPAATFEWTNGSSSTSSIRSLSLWRGVNYR